MLQKEFYEMTKVNLTGEEYADVERIYNSVQMDKFEFCQLWLKNRDNKIIAELMNTIKKMEDDCNALKGTNESLSDEIEDLKALHKTESEQDALMYRNKMKDFADRLIKAGEYDFPRNIYDVVEEELGLSFIIQSKWQQSIELTEEEIDYMVKKL